MKKQLLFLSLCLIFSFFKLNAQVTSTETFETETNNATSFTDNGQIFNISSGASSNLIIQGASPGYGWNGTAADNKYIENSVPFLPAYNVQFTISSSGATPFKLNSMWLLLADNSLNINLPGSLTIIGKLAGVTQYTATASSGFNTSYGVANGFSLINLSNFGGQNNANTVIDQIVISTGGNFVYVALDAFTWTSIPNITATTAQTNLSCNGGSNGSATVTASGGTGPYTYSWAPSGGTAATATGLAAGLAAGTYWCTITDATSDSIVKTFTITQPTAITVSAASQTNISCFGGSNGAASINIPTGGSGGFTYNWTPGNPTGDGTTSVTGLTAGTWTCTVTDANSCTAVRTFTITQPTVLALTAAAQTNIACNGGSNGAASVNNATGGSGGYTYNWTPGNPTGDGTTSVTGLTAGTWTCTVTDANGCTAVRTLTLTQSTALVVMANSQTNISCNGGSNGAASINTPTGGSGGFTYNWTPGNPTGDGTTSVTGLTAGTWTCTVTDANACTKSQTFTITQPSVLTTTTSQNNVSCNGGSNGSAMVSASGGTSPYSYSWTGGGTSATKSGLAAGTYTCTITDDNGCQKVQTVTITQPSPMTVDAGPATVTYCADTITPITATSAPATSNGFQGVYAPANWTFVNGIPSDGNVNTTNAPASITITGGNSYGTNFGGLSGDSTYSIMVTTATTISFNWVYNTNHDPLYDYPQVIVNGNASFLQGYNTVGLNTQSGAMSISIPAGQTFAFNMFTADNMNGAATVTISNLVITNSDVSYSWAATNGGTITGATNTASMTPATSGTYTVTATNANGCTATDSVTVTINTTPAPTATDQWVCYGTTFANVVATGTALQWYDAATGGTAYSSTAIVPLSQTYYVSQTINGCESPRTAVSIGTEIVGAPQAPLPTLTVTVTGNCDSSGGIYEQVADVNGKKSYNYNAGFQIFFNGTYWVAGILGEVGILQMEFFTNTDVSNGIYPPTSGWVNLIACGENIELNNVLTLTINSTSQQFCTGATVADIVIIGSTISPTTINWFYVATGGTALASTTAITTGTYYASQTSPTGCESERTAVSVIVNTTPAPIATTQNFCQNTVATVADLMATGTALQWYDVATGATTLASSTELMSGYNTYYVSQTINGCESLRTPKFVQYYLTTTPTGNATQTLTNANPTISDIVVAGSNLIWFASEADALALQNALPTSTLVTNGSTYYVISYVNNGCASVPFAITITVTLANNSFEVSNKLKIYPNPTSGSVTIDFTNLNNVKLQVIDITGKEIMKQNLNANSNTVNIESLAIGSYMFKISSNEGTATSKVIKK